MCINSISISNFLQILKNCVDKWSCNSFSFPNRTSIERENKSDSTCGKSHSMRISIVEIWIVKIRKVYCLINSVSVYTRNLLFTIRLKFTMFKAYVSKAVNLVLPVLFCCRSASNFRNLYNYLQCIEFHEIIAMEQPGNCIWNQSNDVSLHFYHAERIAAIICLAATNCIGWTASCRTPLFFANSLWNNRL